MHVVEWFQISGLGISDIKEDFDVERASGNLVDEENDVWIYRIRIPHQQFGLLSRQPEVTLLDEQAVVGVYNSSVERLDNGNRPITIKELRERFVV